MSLMPVVAQLRDLASAAASSGTEPKVPPHPDRELLELCAGVVDLHAQADAIMREASRMNHPYVDNPEYSAEMRKCDDIQDRRRSPMMRIPKLSSKTAAGVYAKAYVLKLSHGTAPRLAMSIAKDLVECPGLRSALWPADAPVAETGS